MSCNYTKKHIMPVFGKEPGTGLFIAKICEDWHFVAKIRKDWHFVARRGL
jgi:hypothetical protein